MNVERWNGELVEREYLTLLFAVEARRSLPVRGSQQTRPFHSRRAIVCTFA